MSKIKILVIPPDKHGVGKYRILDPYKFIGDNYSDEIHVDLTFDVPNDNNFFKDYNIVVFHSFIHKSHEENIARINWLKQKGIKTIMDIDDFWNVSTHHPMYLQIKNFKIGERKVEKLKLVDYVTTTTPIFAKTIKDRLNVKNIQIFPNAVNPNESQFIAEPIQSDRTRFGWLGGSSHMLDIELLKNGISGGHAHYKDKIQFVLCGFDLRGNAKTIDPVTKEIKERPLLPQETIWYQYEMIFTDKYSCVDEDYKKYLLSFSNLPYKLSENHLPYVRRWTVEINNYARNYNYFDVSMAPLVENEFNKNKSQLKLIESGFYKKALIASEVEPFTLDLVNGLDEGKINPKGNCLLVSPNKNHKQWFKHIKYLMDNPNMVEDLGNKLYETVKDKYSLINVCKNRVEFLKSII
jgi:glycosyltransferase involved in cell wall biosynthesis